MFAAIEPQAGVSECSVHESAVMGGGGIVIDVRLEEASRHAHPLDGDGALNLESTNDLGQAAE